jgi:glycosyltransferase involved in cell wall biosynthesis
VRVAFDSRGERDPRGPGRYVRCLLDALRETAPAGNTIVETARPRGADVFHAPGLDAAALRMPCPQVVSLHDLIPLRRRSEYLRTGLRFRLRYLAVQRAQRVIVPTQAVRRDAVALLGLADAQVATVPLAAATSMTQRSAQEIAAVRERYGLPGDYLLWVGGLEHPDPRKRVAELVRAPRTLPLVLVGAVREWTRRLEGVTLTGRVDDEELAALYSGARALVFPSDDEGFGLPPVEALACGTPVVVFDVPVLREVLGDRATFVPTGDMDGLLAAGAAAARPAPPPARWTWADAARATWAVYAEAAQAPRS